MYELEDIKKVKEATEKNFFIRDAKEIREIAITNNVDVGVAADMYITDHHLDRTAELMSKYREYTEFCRKYTLKGIVEMLEK